jgi:hypothetical protein
MITEQPKTQQVKISYRFNPENLPYYDQKTRRFRKGNYCRACGSPLKDPVSIARGYGRRCWEAVPVMIVLEIPSSESS